MAKVIKKRVDSKPISEWSFWKVLVLSLVSGVWYHFVNLLMLRSFGEIEIASGLATVIIGLISVIMMLVLGFYRPLMIGLFSALSLWQMAEWLGGLDTEVAILTAIALYLLVYGLYSWLARAVDIKIALITSIIATILIRLVVII